MRARCLVLAGVLALSACDLRNSDTPANSPRPGPGPKQGSTPAPGSLTAADAPSVRGAVKIAGPWTEERLAAEFAGLGADGKPHSNMAGTMFTPDSASWVESTTFQPQITRLESHDGGGLEFRHTRMPPGDYVVYVTRGGTPVAWKKVMVKPGDQLDADLSIDPAKAGDVAVTIPEAEAKDPIRWPLLLVPAGIDLPGTAWHSAFQAADVKPGERAAHAAGVPAGKYRVVRGKSSAEVEVVAGQQAAVTLVREEPKAK